MPEPIELLDTLAGAPTTAAGTSPADGTSVSAPTGIDGLAATRTAGAGSDPALSASGEQLPLQTWDRYRIVSFLGAGGMGRVYKAQDPRLKRSVAIKLLRDSQVQTFDTRQRQRFDREARAQARVDHPNICKIYEVGEVEGQPYIAMQLIQGSSLAGLHQVLTREEKVRVVKQVAEALQAAHGQNLIHRDIKPGNILVERRLDGTYFPYLMDFGLVKEVDSSTHTSTGGIEGTPAFMPPEQARGESRTLDARADIYGLGATLYSVLAGRPPFLGSSADVLLAVLLNDPPRLRSFDPTTPIELETIVHKCLEKEPKLRYQTAQDLAADLGRFLDGQQIVARPPSVARRLGRFAQRRKLLVAVCATAILAMLVLGGIVLRIRIQAAAQAALAQKLGQEITQMEWVLRSARQLPLHNLEREKAIVRVRVAALKSELSGYGSTSRGVAHYALGRGHLALREYPEALAELKQAQARGIDNPELHYALGITLGKHFEQAMYEARLAGGGDWAQKKLKEYEPTYLQPALVALSRGRAVKLDAPQYLEGLIAFYRRDYAEALRQADAALLQAPWLYEARTLQGNVHLAQALQTRDRGQYEDAEKHFAAAVARYTEASTIGASDPEAYEGLAESWVRQIEMARDRGQPTDAPYQAAKAAGGKIQIAAPEDIRGPLKKAFAALLHVRVEDSIENDKQLREGIEAAEAVLHRQPKHPYANEAYASLLSYAADIESLRGREAELLLRKAIAQLEPIVQENPQFLWGHNDLGYIHVSLGIFEKIKGSTARKTTLLSAIREYQAAVLIDPTFVKAVANILNVLIILMTECNSDAEIRNNLTAADEWLNKCVNIDRQFRHCLSNYGQVYAWAAYRGDLAGMDVGAWVARAVENLTIAQKQNAGLDAEQGAALARIVEASVLLRHKQDAGLALSAAREALTRCFGMAAEDATCRAYAAQIEWVAADVLASQGKPVEATLQGALEKARLAAGSREKLPEARWVQAESHLRLAQAIGTPATARAAGIRLREAHIRDGLAAAEQVFAINPNHGQGLATQGALYLLRAQTCVEPATRSQAAAAALKSLERALQRDPLLSQRYSSLLAQARALVATH